MTIKMGIQDKEVSLEFAKGFNEGLKQNKRITVMYLDSFKKTMESIEELLNDQIKKLTEVIVKENTQLKREERRNEKG